MIYFYKPVRKTVVPNTAPLAQGLAPMAKWFDIYIEKVTGLNLGTHNKYHIPAALDP